MKITIVGLGYVGTANAVLLSEKNNVVALDIDKDKIEKINNRISPIDDEEIKQWLKIKKLNLKATLDKNEAYNSSDLVIISTPTDYDPENNYFNVSSIEKVVNDIEQISKNTLIVIKSTIPIGYTRLLRKKTGNRNIIFSPEFLREGKALYDNLYPSRIIVGEKSDRAKSFANLMANSAVKSKVDILLTDSDEAEAIKLFSNSFLALRVAYFNELDVFAESYKLNSKQLIEGVSLDPRIGNFYNNPSFGYGGYCLPKDTKQLKANYQNIPNSIISSIIESNQIRKNHITNSIINRVKSKDDVIGVYKITMKSGSDNFRDSAILDIVLNLKDAGYKLLIFEPNLNVKFYNKIEVKKSLKEFKALCDIIITNRLELDLNDVLEKVYTRDIYNNN